MYTCKSTNFCEVFSQYIITFDMYAVFILVCVFKPHRICENRSLTKVSAYIVFASLWFNWFIIYLFVVYYCLLYCFAIFTTYAIFSTINYLIIKGQYIQFSIGHAKFGAIS